MAGMCDDPVVGQSRRDAMPCAVPLVGRRRVVGEFTVDRIKTVVMTAEQYEQAVDVLATLIVHWMTTPGKHTALRLEPVSSHPGAD